MAMSEPGLSRSPLQSHNAAMELRDLILGGGFAAGERLLEVQLAERLGVSRTPLRSALAQLEQEGLVERKSTTGFVVRQFTFNDVVDAIELRGVLEGTAARLAAERGISEVQRAEMGQILDRLDQSLGEGPDDMDLDRYVDANGTFHEMILVLSQSAIVRREVERAVRLPFASPNSFLERQREVPAFRRSIGSGQIHHRAVADAIWRREGARAEAVMREHARLARTNLEYVMTRDRSLMNKVPGLSLVVT
ncbi:GntR family transcriptional regulator [Aurantimonas sp. VKM B-3413]|uniref:GntR family transcriptional regulator n=1 Tax=Aurantimonas sp. VKM B-3413 TaxID=2779401 RepID=UPI001E28A149|nr:GntR family transcriptional regulator [Aurantimonas sp. VKM B-3413]MCB8836408.1 GntR family transcriptional regulator [Aurantimonas sp. VKM B-3413]